MMKQNFLQISKGKKELKLEETSTEKSLELSSTINSYVAFSQVTQFPLENNMVTRLS